MVARRFDSVRKLVSEIYTAIYLPATRMGTHATNKKRFLSKTCSQAIKLADMPGGRVLNHFQFSALSDYDKMIHSHLKLSVDCNLPISIVESQNLRAVSRYRETVDTRNMTDVLVSLVQLIEKKISGELQRRKSRCFVMHALL